MQVEVRYLEILIEWRRYLLAIFDQSYYCWPSCMFTMAPLLMIQPCILTRPVWVSYSHLIKLHSNFVVFIFPPKSAKAFFIIETINYFSDRKWFTIIKTEFIIVQCRCSCSCSLHGKSHQILANHSLWRIVSTVTRESLWIIMLIKFNEQLPSQSHFSQTKADHGTKGLYVGRVTSSVWSLDGRF